MKISVNISLSREVSNYDTQSVASVDVKQNMIAGSAAREKEIVLEVENVVTDAYDKVMGMIRASNLLADGQTQEDSNN